MFEETKESNIEIDNKKLRNILIKYLISLSILLLILLITLINTPRISMFGKVIGSFSGAFEGIGVVLFYLSLFSSILYFAALLIFVLIRYKLDKEWKSIILKIDRKTDIVAFIFEVFSTLLFIMIFVFTPCTIRGDSMNPTFLSGQNVVCFNYMGSSPKKNEIIVFDARNENFQVDDVFYIKRVVAIPGSKINYDLENFTLYVDNEKVEIIGKDKFKRINESIGLQEDNYDYVVPKNKYLVLGDNRNISQDSRSFGYINKKQIFGKVTMRIFPLNKIKFY